MTAPPEVFYSPSTGGFYLPALHGAGIPEDAVAITAEAHAALLDAQGAGMRIVPGAGGLPEVQPPQPAPPPTPEQLAAAARARRDALLAASDWAQLADAPLGEAALAAWRAYRQALRDLPAQPGWPAEVAWPAKPDG